MIKAKTTLRQALKWQRMELTTAELTLASRAISARLADAADWSAVKTVHFFEPIQQLMEVDLNDFISGLQDKYADMRFFTPKNIENEWQTVGLQPGDVPDSFDVVIVPMLGFDARLQRIGYGGGYYDRFLAGQPDALKLGVCLELGKIEQVPTEPHDVPLDVIVTEDDIYKR
jgi:5-formyltetrahydrofolate cyclo-ligase